MRRGYGYRMPLKLPASKRLSHRVQVLMTKDDFRALSERAAAAGISVGEYMRRKSKDEPVPESKRR